MKQNLKLMKAELKRSREKQGDLNQSFAFPELKEHDSKLSTYVMQPLETSFFNDKMATQTLK